MSTDSTSEHYASNDVNLYYSYALQKNRFHNKWQYLYIESICNDPQVLEQNYRYKMMYSPDYKDVNTEEVRNIFVTDGAFANVLILSCTR